MLAGLGVSHVIWRKQKSIGWDTLEGDLVFFSLARFLRPNAREVRGIYVAPLPTSPVIAALASPDALVTIGTCEARSYPSGIYHLADLTVPFYGPKRFEFPEPVQVLELSERWPPDALDSDFLALEADCYTAKTRRRVLRKFDLLATRREPAIGKRKYQRELFARKVDSP